MRYQIYEAKSVKYDAQQRVGIEVIIPQSVYFYSKSSDFIVFIHILCIIPIFEAI